MRRYLSTIHKRSDAHKKRFALGISGGITLIIFLSWFVVRYGVNNTPVADTGVLTDTKVAVLEPDNVVTPFQTVQSNFAALWGAVKSGFNQTKDAVESVNTAVKNQNGN